MEQQGSRGAWTLAIMALASVLLLASGAFPQSTRLRIVTSEEPPTNYTLNGKLTGITTDIVKAILAKLGQDMPIEVYPWARAYNIALSEPNVAIFTAGITRERVDHGFFLVGPVTTRRHSLYKKAGRDLTVRSLEDVKRQHLSVGAMRGDWRAEYLKDRGVAVDMAVEHQQNLKKLLAGRIDLFVLSDLELPETLGMAGVDHPAVELALVFDERPAYIMLSKGTPESVAAEWGEAFRSLQNSDFFQNLARNWSGILGMPVSYDPARGLMIDSPGK